MTNNDVSVGCLATGTYVGDGAISKAIAGLGFAPKFIIITPRETASQQPIDVFMTSDQIIDDHASGMSVVNLGSGMQCETLINCIIALGADGFTVDDQGSDSHPNKNGQTYNYVAFG